MSKSWGEAWGDAPVGGDEETHLVLYLGRDADPVEGRCSYLDCHAHLSRIQHNLSVMGEIPVTGSFTGAVATVASMSALPLK